MELAVIDIGGTTIKFARWDGTALQDRHAAGTPADLEGFYTLLSTEVAQMKKRGPLAGVAISSPGAVNQATGVIEGASALPYIHNFEIVPELERRFGLKVAIENDANCAALAEVDSGAAAGKSRVAVLVLGTGVGGAIIADGHIEHGHHLLGGEFGYMMQNGRTLSEQGTAVSVGKAYREESGENLSGKDVFDRADDHDPLAVKLTEALYQSLAEAIFNLQYSFDPEVFLIGGGISRNPALLPGIRRHIEQVMAYVKIADVTPQVASCKYLEAANLMGAIANFKQRYAD
ncbi:ROK family protein [Lacticaseibacillus parakribbianus]|uniref:ROK family protein n=1 Tax=Lacticaseibacillus parakribbianus TaxID=2970927 RepID=UPI0021CB1D8A|nr:ROK family protein [Lacticaseibacillus parakribbianus]